MSSNTAAITMYCQGCGRSLFECECKGDVPLVCGTCGKAAKQCQCDYDFMFKRCSFCLQFKESTAQDAATGRWVCHTCLEKPAVKFELEHGK